jgi:hypothetical protein
MATTYYSRDTNSDLSGGGSFSYQLLRAAGAAATLTGFAVGKAATVAADLYTDPNDPSDSGSSTGTWTFEINIVSGDANVQLTPSLYRINSSGGTLSGPISATPQNTNAGVLTFSWTNPALGTFAATNRIRVGLSFLNGTHTNATLDIGFNDNNSEFITPYTLVGPKPFAFAVSI